jgi:DNA replication protein DnaC
MAKYELIVLDEVGYVPLADVGAEFLFQVISDRAEKAALIVTTNLPFSEWTTVFPNPRLCKALLDRITDRAHIVETGIGIVPVSTDYGRKDRKNAENKNINNGVKRSPE